MSDYNGWKNYETWNVALWIDNDQGLTETIAEMAQAAYDAKEHIAANGNDLRQYEFAGTLKDFIEEMAPDLGASMWADLLNAALSEVDWYELAGHYLDEAKENLDTGAI